MGKNQLLVSEIFGPTVQGEGPSLGKPVMFLRLGVCNQHCWWCDTAYTWRFTDQFPHKDNTVYDKKKELSLMDFDTIIEKLLLSGFAPQIDRVVVSGGEPMLQASGLFDLIYQIKYGVEYNLLEFACELVDFEIETAGTVWNQDLANLGVQFNVSLKLENSGNPIDLRYKPEIIDKFVSYKNAFFKFVICTKDDLYEVTKLISNHQISHDRVWVMAEGRSPSELKSRMVWLADEAIKQRWNISPRLHVDIWGDERGK